MKALLKKKTLACRTINTGRKGFPVTMKNVKGFCGERGDVRWVREGDLAYLQWKDNKVVSFAEEVAGV